MIENNIQNPVQDIMHYESDIWAVADLLLAAGIKQSDFPAYMMPFFALVMVEGRMINTVKTGGKRVRHYSGKRCRSLQEPVRRGGVRLQQVYCDAG